MTIYKWMLKNADHKSIGYVQTGSNDFSIARRKGHNALKRIYGGDSIFAYVDKNPIIKEV